MKTADEPELQEEEKEEREEAEERGEEMGLGREDGRLFPHCVRELDSRLFRGCLA